MPKAKSKGKRKPVRHSLAIYDRIVKRLSTGETLRSICLSAGMPSWWSVYDWMDKDKDFASRIARARELGHDAIAEECLAIAQSQEVGQTVTVKTGGKNRGREVKKADMTEHRKLKIWTRLQLLAKWNPQKYGDRVAVDHGVQANLVDRLNAGRRRAGK